MEAETKNPGKTGRHPKTCDCAQCKTRVRVKEAIARSVRDGGDVQIVVPREEILNADLEPLLTIKHKGRDRVAKWIALRAQFPDETNAELAKRLGMTPGALASLIKRAVKGGWLQFEDPLARIEHEIIPKAVDNLSEFLDKKDRQVTIEVAKGTIFKQFQESKGLNEKTQTILAVKIETIMPSDAKIIGGNIVGKAKVLEAEFKENEIALERSDAQMEEGRSPLGLEGRSEGHESGPGSSNHALRETES